MVRGTRLLLLITCWRTHLNQFELFENRHKQFLCPAVRLTVPSSQLYDLRSARPNDGSSGCRAAFCGAHAHGRGSACNAPWPAPDLTCKGQRYPGGQRMAAHATRLVAQYFYSLESCWPQSLLPRGPSSLCNWNPQPRILPVDIRPLAMVGLVGLGLELGLGLGLGSRQG